MNNGRSIKLWLVCTVLLVSALACGTGGGANTATEEPATEPPATEATGVGDTGSDLSGLWNITGANPDGSEYSGTLEIGVDGDVNILTWVIGDITLLGTGLVNNEAQLMAAVYPRELCYLTIYGVQGEAAETLDGIWVQPNGSSIASETGAINAAGSTESVLAYDIQGTNPDGSTYSGSMTLTLVGEVYSMEQHIGESALFGTGIPVDEWIIVGFGEQDANCGVTAYRIGDNTLDGVWAQLNVASTLGTETATR